MKPKILVVGDVMLDRYIHGTVERISPEAPIPILRRTHIEDRAGGAANVAANLASLGADTMLVGAIGADRAGDTLASLCKAIGRRYLTINAPLGLTTVKERYVCAGQQMLRVDQDGGRPTERAMQDIEQAVAGQLERSSALILSDYAGGVVDWAPNLIVRAKRHGVPVYVDPKGTDWGKYSGATLIKPNESELRAVVGGGELLDLLDRGADLLHELDIDKMLVTLGAAGMALVHRGGYHDLQNAKSGPVVDVTGAGDTVLAVVAYLRAVGCDDWRGVILPAAARGAAAVCSRHGTSVVEQSDLAIPEASAICSLRQWAPETAVPA